MEPPELTPEEYAAIRTELGLSLAKMGTAVGADASTIFRRERGDRLITGEPAHAILRVAEIMGLDVARLLGRQP